jgi:Family of unknown function (DUF6158)
MRDIERPLGPRYGGQPPSGRPREDGIAPAELTEHELQRELEQLHRTRHETFLHASVSALETHSERTAELEDEYLRRHPGREVDQQRLREGARRRGRL